MNLYSNSSTISLVNSYQLTLLIKNEIDEKARKELFESLAKKFTKVEKEDLWGTRDLAYPILKQDKAFYAYYEFQANPGDIASIDKSIKLNEDIIRYLLIRKD